MEERISHSPGLPLSSTVLQFRLVDLNCVGQNSLPMIQTVTVRVPASTSNLGPGFDCLGIALRLYNLIEVARDSGAGAPSIIDEAARLFFKETARRPFRFSFSSVGSIPRARGLGSSATARVGVLHALNRLAGDPLDRSGIFRLSAQLEGHPDNAAPATFGGFTVTSNDVVQKFAVSSRLRFVLLIPDFEVKTSSARKVLPGQIRLQSAIKNCANACAITAAFASGKYRDLSGTFADQFHQPFRKKLLPFLPRVIAAAEKAGALGAFLSGSGSTIAAVTLESPKAVARAMLLAIGQREARIEILSADNQGARVFPIGRR
ncbi:MAG: homoserine kinase [Verrucomicrobiota bacterium]|jgi:homoserine kinase